MARVLIVGCGCRGRRLARELAAAGHVVRGTTRGVEGRAAIQATGAEPWIGDPDRVGTLTGALDNVTVVCWLLAGAKGGEDSLRDLHGPRLRAFCERLVDTTVRGLIYEAVGAVDDAVLATGRGIVAEAARTWEIPVRTVESPPEDGDAWLSAARAAVTELLAAPRGAGGPGPSATLGPEIAH
jgi:hypothetical protein